MYQTVYKVEILDKAFTAIDANITSPEFVKLAMAFAKIINPEVEPGLVDSFYLKELMSDEGVTRDWPFIIEDMKELAIQFPDYYFRLSCAGEDELDRSVACFNRNVMAQSFKTEEFEVDDDLFGWTEV